jgi:hypothetical protein
MYIRKRAEIGNVRSGFCKRSPIEPKRPESLKMLPTPNCANSEMNVYHAIKPGQ